MVCDVSGKGGKEKEEKKDKEEGELTSCESVQERRRQENENSALESIWEKAAYYWPEHVRSVTSNSYVAMQVQPTAAECDQHDRG